MIQAWYCLWSLTDIIKEGKYMKRLYVTFSDRCSCNLKLTTSCQDYCVFLDQNIAADVNNVIAWMIALTHHDCVCYMRIGTANCFSSYWFPIDSCKNNRNCIYLSVVDINVWMWFMCMSSLKSSVAAAKTSLPLYRRFIVELIYKVWNMDQIWRVSGYLKNIEIGIINSSKHGILRIDAAKC